MTSHSANEKDRGSPPLSSRLDTQKKALIVTAKNCFAERGLHGAAVS